MAASTNFGTGQSGFGAPTKSMGVPYFFLVSTTKIPSQTVLTISSTYPWVFNIYRQDGTYLTQITSQVSQQIGSAASPFIATIDFSKYNVTLPTYISADIVDGGSYQQSNYMANIPLLGGDVYKITVIYRPDIPAQKELLVGGQPYMATYKELADLAFTSSDVQTHGSY